MQLSQPTLEPHSLWYTCWVQVVYSLLSTLRFSSCPLWGHPTAAQFLVMRRSSLGATRSTKTSRHSNPSRRPGGALLPRASHICFLRFRILCIRHFVINEINNILICFIISFYVLCAMIYYLFCCIYVWLDPGTYMIARFMSFYKPGVTPWKKIRQKYGTRQEQSLFKGQSIPSWVWADQGMVPGFGVWAECQSIGTSGKN